MTTEAGMGIADEVTASMEDCRPEEPQAPADAPVPEVPEAADPSRQSQDATLGQTGADPPPEA